MRINSSTVGMESARSYQSTSVSMRYFTVKEYTGKLSGQLLGQSESSPEEKEDTAQTGEEPKTTEENTSLQEWQNRFSASPVSISVSRDTSQTLADIRQQTIKYIFELLFGKRKNWLFGENSYHNADSISQSSNSQTVSQTQTSSLNMKAFVYSQKNYYCEKESTSFATTGMVKTADGREISFQVNVGMSREFEQTFQQELALAQFSLCDPLVINLDSDTAEISDQTFYFDIDADGKKDEIHQLGKGSGYLALDKNGDGVINDGSELFGTASGDGFADLAKYDEDGNGWIDENDAVWDKLKIWCKDENGEDVLYTLKEKGVGAICLQKAATEFTEKTATGQTKGVVRNTGVFLYESGLAGTIQHVDMARFEEGA